MGDQVEMGDAVSAAPVDELMHGAAAAGGGSNDAFAAVEGNGNGNGHVSEAMEGQVQEQAAEEQPPVVDLEALTPEEERLWNVVKEDAADFNSWTSLIQEAEKLEVLSKVEKTYDAFLAEFPLCYGYWKKYADHELKLGSSEKVVDVYERAVKAVTYSVDMWMNYCTYAMEKFEDPEAIRGLFERGISFVGTDYLSHLLWDKYLEFEHMRSEWSRVAQIYTRILQVPLQQLDRYHASFRHFAYSHPLTELMTDEESEASKAAAAPKDSPPGDQEITTVPETDGVTEPAKPAEVTLEPSGTEDLEKYVAVREEFYKTSKEWDAKIRDFEIAIRRPYFHVRPLDDAQLGNWHKYLDFIEKEGGIEKTIKLYERCLIACANYSEYWVRYVHRMDEEGKIESALDALHRASSTFVKRRPEIHLFAARYQEQLADIKGARASYEVLSNSLAPGLLEAIVKHANFEKRQGNGDTACSLFESALELGKIKEDSRARAVLYIQYARFLDQVLKSPEKARKVYSTALDSLPSSKTLLEAVTNFEASHHPGISEVEYVNSLVDKAIAPSKIEGSSVLSAADREELSIIRLEFVDSFGSVEDVKKSEARHVEYFPPPKSTVESKKRPSLDNSVPDRAKVHKPYVGATATAPVTGPPAYSGQTQWNTFAPQAGYAQQSQGWQQPPIQQPTPPVQSQQWNQGYAAHQGGYAGYGGYTSYGPPQQQAPVPQQPPYGGYGQGYPQEVNGWSSGGW
ncbi:pre-mRNA-processing factor 39-1 isoform X4 [Physcomitrium patens]|uniref:Suppressor of forked domain-containing protein n=1 Tax=Physcomitrium patens TaxID=3218 RepID=A0A7I4CYG8_PHYPA|nr:pre-mRNA-processing factor 39-like isoform X4 [Physcomitrium patens]|eukprot:XP_024366580.1 pre-mRNA-processing factor 39-like isoform X4 [Physcomitrella patens]